jgi:two-component system sensor histidine kinase MprB
MPELIRTIHFRAQTFRQLLISLPVNTRIECPNESRVICVTEMPSVQVFSLNISGQQEQIADLNRNLIVVFVVMLAVGLALAVGAARTAVRPLVRVTADIESIDRRKNFSLRLEEGGLDEIGRLRRTFNSLLSTVEESQVLQQQLVMDASHELRTPLTSLRMNAELLQRSDLDSEEVHQITDDVVSQVDELTSLTRDLVELARGEHSQGDIEQLRLDEIVAECALTANTHARVRNISLTTDLHPLALDGRHDRWERAISNLINNAIKFTPAGGQVRISTDSLRLIVEDSGSGVIPAEREFVFERFWRSPSSRSQPGSGLGLAIVAQVVAEHDCTIAVSASHDFGGAAFIVTLPDAVGAHHPV